MTTSKWIGTLGALFIAIFGLTFVSNYLAQPKSDDNDPSAGGDDLPNLNIPITRYPYPARSGMLVGRAELEHRKPGHQDYWFFNSNDEKIRLGAISKSCKCQGVEVYVLPEGVEARPPLSPPQPNIALPLGLIGRVGLETFIENRSSIGDLESRVESFVVLNPEDSNAEAEVPPRRAGWIRMKWTGEKAGKMNLTAKLWLHHPGSGLEVELERMADFVDPVRVVATELKFANKKLDELPFSSSFFVWSATRKNFNITKAESGRPAGMPASADPFTIGEPVALTVDQCDRVGMALNQGRVLSGYRIPVTLQKVAADGKSRFDLGNFRRRVEVRTDASDKPLFTTFIGVIQGDLHVSGVDESGGIAFDSFRRDSRPKRFALVRSDNPAEKLELDKSRVPEYISAALTQEPNPAGPGAGPSGTWKLEVVVLPSAYGPFPRDDDPTYRDSAVYVRTVGPSPHTVRIAIKGDAADR
jgi:hypothetical protein